MARQWRELLPRVAMSGKHKSFDGIQEVIGASFGWHEAYW